MKSRTIVGPMALVVMFGAGCAKQPATSAGISTPSPGVAVGAADPSTQASRPPSPAETGPLRLDGDQAVRSMKRPRPQDFRLISDLPDVYFDFDRYDIRSGDKGTLDENANWLKSNQSTLLLI